MIMMGPIPGQEVHTATYVMEKDAGVMAMDEVGVIFIHKWIVNETGRLAPMQTAARATGTPQASYAILSILTTRYHLS